MKKQKQFITKIQSVCSSFTRRNINVRQVIDDLMQLGCNLLSEPTFIEVSFKNVLWACDGNFRKELSHYKDEPAAWNLLQELFSDYLNLIGANEPFTDIIGMIYDETAHKGNNLGQFLTPPDVADVLGELLVGLKPDPIRKSLSIGDFCGCGAGSLILGQIKAIYNQQGEEALTHLNVVANDLDACMAKMATVQVVFSSIVHRMPLSSFTAFNANTIAQYREMDEGKHIIYNWIPNAPNEFYFMHKNPQYAAYMKLMKKFNEAIAVDSNELVTV
jgi:type I restriction-modification system DNA methylase subunit